MTTSVWLFEPRSHGRKKAATCARNGAPLPGWTPSFRLPHRSASPALCPCGQAASFRRHASSFVRGVWCLESGAAASGGGAMRARAVCAACRAAWLRTVLPCGCGCSCGGVCVATLTTSGARGVGSARVMTVWNSVVCVGSLCLKWQVGSSLGAAAASVSSDASVDDERWRRSNGVADGDGLDTR